LLNKNDLILVIGAYGSGKSEYAINLAQNYQNMGRKAALVDLDVVNPYFRSRDVRDYFHDLGIEVISPEGEYGHADLPMLSPRIAGTIQNEAKTVILDIGGDPTGCRALGRFIDSIKKRGYSMQFVVNTLRPFTSTVEEILSMMKMLEAASRLQISELIANVNLMGETTNEMVKEGIDILKRVAEQSQVRFNTYLVIEGNKKIIEDNIAGKKREVLNYYLKKPWDRVYHPGI